MPIHDSILITILCTWFTIIGACVGSFLNVFVHRIPRRKSLVHPPSHCPCCGHPIRWYDNIPVFGWIKLRGKCRDCGQPISVRYPCVEGISGMVFGGIFILLAQFLGDSLGLLIGLSLPLSLLGVSILAAGLIAYDKWSGK